MIVTFVLITMYVDGVHQLINVYQETWDKQHVQEIVSLIGYLKKNHVKIVTHLLLINI